MILVSACLLGKKCKYSGGDNWQPLLADFLQDQEYLPICPEEAGGLPTPRPPAEIIGGSGENVLHYQAKVYNQKGRDVSKNFIQGAQIIAQIAQKQGAKFAILKEGSPSCGCYTIYDGTFQGRKIQGQGITAALLRDLGLKIFNEEQIELLKQELGN